MDNYLCYDINNNAHIVPQTELQIRHSVYALIIKDNEILLTKDITSEQRWSFPGGGVEPNEDQFTALAREVQEETSLSIDNPILITHFIEYFYDIYSKQGFESHRSFYTVEWQGTPNFAGNNDDITAGQYFPLTVTSPLISPSTQKIITLAQTK